MISTAYVSGLMHAITCNQYGIKDSGASAVLANNVGKLMNNVVKAINSICPGKINALNILRLEIFVMTNVVEINIVVNSSNVGMCPISYILNRIIMKI